MNTITCRLCGDDAHFQFKKVILSKLDVSYYECKSCGGLETEEPYWLEEAYQPINEQLDTGQFIRCLQNASFLNVIYKHLSFGTERLIDFGCGSGLTARILRDVGINAFGYDVYSEPRLLMGFKVDSLEGASIINVCEVAEHLAKPKITFEEIFSSNPDIVVVQTEIFREANQNWHYLAPEHGQHIFFYSEKTIAHLAKHHKVAATFINGFVVFFRLKFLDNFFNKNSFVLRRDLSSKLNYATQNLLQELLNNGFKYAIKDNQMLTESIRNQGK